MHSIVDCCHANSVCIYWAYITCCTVVQSKVLRTTWSVNANKTTLYPSHSETLWPIDTIFGSINYALEMYKPTKFGADRLKGGAATRWWNITTLCIFSVCIYLSIHWWLSSPTPQVELLARSLSLMASTTRCPVRKGLLEEKFTQIQVLGVQCP